MAVGRSEGLIASLNRNALLEMPAGFVAALKVAELAAPVCFFADLNSPSSEKPPEIPGVDTAALFGALSDGGIAIAMRFDDGIQLRFAVACRDSNAAGVVKTQAEALLKAAPGDLKKLSEKVSVAISPLLARLKQEDKDDVVSFDLAVTTEEAIAIASNTILQFGRV